MNSVTKLGIAKRIFTISLLSLVGCAHLQISTFSRTQGICVDFCRSNKYVKELVSMRTSGTEAQFRCTCTDERSLIYGIDYSDHKLRQELEE
jgi:hypothetical protein